MLIKFYGVRGSIASPGADTVRYGGNTSCVSVEAEDGSLVVFDAGTGIRELGKTLGEQASEREINLLFSHYHWDHIQGFPFFLPAYQKDQVINLLAAHLDDVNVYSILTQMTDPHFPVPSDKLEAKITLLSSDKNGLLIGSNNIYTKRINHPGGGSAYILENDQGSMAYITDNELFPPNTPETSYEEWVAFVQNVDFLIHDAMYLDEELKNTHGWGHSLISQTLQLAVDAKVPNLVLFHHDPARTDEQLDMIKQKSRDWMKQKHPNCQVYVAKEGDEYRLNKGSVVRKL